jgi:hypothetical protein
VSRFSDFIRNATPEEKEAVYMDVMKKATERQNAVTAPSAPLPEERTVSVRELVRLLEGSAGNTDTDWRWQAATALRKCPHWETLKLILRSDG